MPWRPGGDLHRRGRRFSSALAAATLVVVVAACTDAPAPAPHPSRAQTSVTQTAAAPGPRLTWSRVALPDDAEPLTLTADGDQLLVGADTVTGVRPRLFSVASEAAVDAVPLDPRTIEGGLARWQSVTVDGAHLLAIGGHPAGAHSNTRWTTWTGTTAGVRETPQLFNTFGGWGAGDLVGGVITTAGSAVVGSWQGVEVGLDAAVWLPMGDRWVRQTAVASALRSRADLLVSPRSAVGAGRSIVVVGSVVHLGAGTVRETASIWRSQRLNSGWSRSELPESGSRSEAVSATCGSARCLVAGYADGGYALWSVAGATTARVSGIPALPIEITDELPVPLQHDQRSIAVVPTRGQTIVLSGSGNAWAQADGPTGTATSAALVGHWIYVVTHGAGAPAVLWRSAADPLY